MSKEISREDDIPQQRQLPPLLPRRESRESSNANSSNASQPKLAAASSSNTTVKPSRASSAIAACEPCRQRKSKCSAERPSCQACIQRDLVCHYSTAVAETRTQALKRKLGELEAQKTPYQEFFEILQTMDEAESINLLRRVRTGADVETIVRQVREGNLLIQLSLSPDSTRIYQIPYFSFMPPSTFLDTNTYMDCCCFRHLSQNRRETDQAMIQSTPEAVDCNGMTRPYHTAELANNLISKVSTDKWTSVITDDALFRSLLNSYLVHDWTWCGSFSHDDFLEDMQAGRERFCSPLLVNSVLAVACNSFPAIANRHKFWDPQQLGYRFLAEAKRLWEFEVGHSRLTTIQAAIALSVASNSNAMDKMGLSYLEQAVAMAQSMRLFTRTSTSSDERLQRARSHTAWGLFNWQAMQGFYFFRPPLLAKSPEVILPDPSTDPQWYDTMRLRYTNSSQTWPSFNADVFKHMAGLRVITNDMASYFFEPTRKGKAVPFSIVSGFKSRLEAWFRGLPECLSPSMVMLPAPLRLHMEYQSLLISLLESTGEYSASQISSVHDALVQAKLSLELLLRRYYRHHSATAMDPFLTYFMFQIGKTAQAALVSQAMPTDDGDVTRKTLLATVVLCASGLSSQAQCTQIARLLFRMFVEQLPAEHKDLIGSYIRTPRDSEDDELAAKYVKAQFVLPIVTLNDDPTPATVENLVRRVLKKK